jgi:hypothetical protein
MKSLYLFICCFKSDQQENRHWSLKQGDSITKQVLQVAEFTGQQVTGVTRDFNRTDFL